MITDKQTNTVYFSNLLPEEYPDECTELFAIIKDAGYNVKLLRATYDFYCRDYMPVQIADKDFVQFIFRPKAYFQEEWYEEITNPIVAELSNKIVQPRYSPIILDGGNIIKGESKVLITDRVLKDNRYQFPDDKAILERLKFDFKSDVIIIPEYPKEQTGHADGLVRFIDEETVFINDASTEPEKAWLREFLMVLSENSLLHINLPCDVDTDMETAEGLYLNYLHVGNLIVVPQFGNKLSDKKALATMNEVFGKTHKVVTFIANWIAESGGVFNCMSWTVKE